MKKNNIIILAAFATMAMACTKEISDSPVKEGNTTFKVNVCEVAKSELAADGRTVNWLSTDKLSVFDAAGSNCEFQALSVDGASATFTGNTAGAGVNGFVALYPYNASASISGSVISTTLPAEQTLKAGSFADGLNMGVATIAPGASNCTFQGITSLIKFTIPAELTDIARVEISSPEVIAGDFTVDCSGAEPVVVKGSGSTKVVLTNGGSKIAPGTYYASVLPGDITGISIKLVTLMSETATFTSATAVKLNMSRVRSLGTVKWDYKKLYDAGQTITICGQAFNKATYGDSKELVANTADFDIPKNNTIGWAAVNTGVVFLSEEEGCNFTNTQYRDVNADKTFVLIGRYRGLKPTIKQGAQQIRINGGSFVLKNITIQRTNSGTYFFGQNNAATQSKAFYMDDCVVKDIAGGQFFYLGQNYGVKDILIENCTFDLGLAEKTSGMFINASNCTAMDQYENLVFRNNVVYNPAFASYTIFSCNGKSANEGHESVILDRNTFYNVCSGANGLVYHQHIENLTVTKNLFHMNTTGFTFRVYRVASANAPTITDIDKNFSFGLYSSSWILKYGDSTLIDRVYPNNVDPLPNVVNAYTDYTPIAKYIYYGAKR